MSARSGKAFFMACGQRDATVGMPMSRDTKTSGHWLEWAKRAYFIGFTTTKLRTPKKLAANNWKRSASKIFFVLICMMVDGILRHKTSLTVSILNRMSTTSN